MSKNALSLLVGATALLLGIILMILWSEAGDAVAKVLILTAVPALLYGVWRWAHVDVLLGVALVIGLVLGALAWRALADADQLFAREVSPSERQAVLKQAHSERSTGHLLLVGIAGASVVAAWRIRRALRTE